MKIFENMKAKWKAMSTTEKVKLLLEGVCNLGADILVGYLGGRLIPADEKRWKKAACSITACGLGMAVGKAASDQLGEVVDSFAPKKNEQEEGNG